MAHIFDIMSSICGQINILSDYYSGVEVSIRNLPHLPNFVVVSINRAIDTMPNIIQDPNKKCNTEFVTILNTNDPFTTIYLCVSNNINEAIVDKVPVMINYKDNKGPGLGYIIVIPRMVFENDVNSDDVAKLFTKLYLTLLDTDPNMQFKAEPEVLKMHKSQKARIYTYDITMILVAIGFANINMRTLFVMDNDRRPLDSIYTLSAFTSDEMPDDLKGSVSDILDQYAVSIDKLKDGIGSGRMLRDLLYKD